VRLAILAVIPMLPAPVFAVELFRYRGAAGGRRHAGVRFREQSAGRYDDSHVLPHVQVGALESLGESNSPFQDDHILWVCNRLQKKISWVPNMKGLRRWLAS
jgi:hypothetical protein